VSSVRPPSLVPAQVDVPAPGAPEDLDPLLTTWQAGRPFHRCYDVSWGSRDFYPGDAAHRGRFHPFTPSGGTDPLPVLYGASDFDGAVFETVFHDVPVKGVKRVPHAKLLHRLVVVLVPGRDLILVDLTSEGLRRLELTRSELIDSDARSYPDIAAWGSALHAHSPDIDGLLWVSRQRDTSRALVLFGDRVDVTDLTVDPDEVPLTLGIGRGLDLVAAAASRAGITITGLA
jgi:RES domain-containing protein